MTDRRPGERSPHAPRTVLERHWSRTHSGTEPLTARTALRVRLILASLFTPLFLVGTALFAYWMTQTGPGDVPGADSLRTLTVICAALAAFSLVDLTVVLLRRRRERTGSDEGRTARGAGGHRGAA